MKNLECPIKDIGNKRWTLDEDEDYQFINNVYTYFIKEKHAEEFNTKDILEYLLDNPEIEKINSKFARNEGLTKSLDKDYKVELGD